MDPTEPLFKKIDCLQIPVPDLDAGLAFYRDQLGHAVIWRTQTQVGLRLARGDAEIVLQTERAAIEVDLTVESVADAVASIIEAGGTLVTGPVHIPIGLLAVVADPFGNQLVILDNANGTYEVDDDGTVKGVRR